MDDGKGLQSKTRVSVHNFDHAWCDSELQNGCSENSLLEGVVHCSPLPPRPREKDATQNVPSSENALNANHHSFCFLCPDLIDTVLADCEYLISVRKRSRQSKMVSQCHDHLL